MNRSEYEYDVDNWALIRYRGAVASAIRGKRWQAFFCELVAALDSMPTRELIANDLIDVHGQYCALGLVAKNRGIDVGALDPFDHESVAVKLGISDALAREIAKLYGGGGHRHASGFRVPYGHELSR